MEQSIDKCTNRQPSQQPFHNRKSVTRQRTPTSIFDNKNNPTARLAPNDRENEHGAPSPIPLPQNSPARISSSNPQYLWLFLLPVGILGWILLVTSLGLLITRARKEPATRVDHRRRGTGTEMSAQ